MWLGNAQATGEAWLLELGHKGSNMAGEAKPEETQL